MMANLSEDIQYNGVNILKSIDEGPFKMGKFRETLAEGAKGALHLGPERDRVFADLTPKKRRDIWDNVKMLIKGSELTKDERKSQLYNEFEPFSQNKGETIHEYYVRGRFVTVVKLNRGLKQSNYDQLYAYLKQHEAHANENKMMLERYNQHAIDPLALVSNVLPHQYSSQSSIIPQSAYVPPGRQNRSQGNHARGAVAAGNGGVQNRNSEYFKDKMLLMQAQENRAVLDEKQLLFIAADQCDAFDSDVDEALTAQTMFMTNLSSADPIYDKAGPSYDSDILSEVQDHDNYVDSVSEYHEVHEMQNDVQPNYVVDLDTEYTSDSTIIPYEQYSVKCVSANEHNKVVNESLTVELARYKEQVQLYEKEQVKTIHALAVVHDSEDTLEIAKKTRIGILEKMKSTLMLKEHFEGIQTALVIEVKEMKEIFEQMEAEVEQNAVDKQCADIERKNLLIQNENLIANWLSNEVLYSVMNDGNTVSKFSKMHDAYTVEQVRCLELKAKLSKLKHKIQKDDHSEMIKCFSNLETDHLNLQLKYQNLKESFGNNKSQPSQDTPEFDTVFEIIKMKASLQGKDNAIRKLKEQISQMNKRRSEADRILDFKALDFYNIELTEKITTLQEQNELFRVENEKVKQHCKELNNREVHLDYLKHLKESVETLREIVEDARIEKPLDNALGNACFYTKRSQEWLEYVIGTCLKDINKKDKKVATTPLNRKKQVTFKETSGTSNDNTQKHVKPQKEQKTNVLVIPSTGVISSTKASGSKPSRNTKNTKILPARSDQRRK
ncbi:hypothetical protein Tco_1485264 [Tanacetum coccineum]